MINKYVKHLVSNLPDYVTKSTKPTVMDIVLDGGAFNGSYLIGALYFLKEMETCNYINIRRISGCSVGAIIGFVFLIDNLKLSEEIYNIVMTELKQNHTMTIVKNLKKYINITNETKILEMVNNRLFITYYDTKKEKKIIKSHYKSIDNLFDIITRSAFIPYIVDGNMLYKNKYY